MAQGRSKRSKDQESLLAFLTTQPLGQIFPCIYSYLNVYTVKPFCYNDKIRYNDYLNGTIP